MANSRPKKKLRWYSIPLIILTLAALAVLGRFAYVMFIDPMSAFGDNKQPVKPINVDIELPPEETAAPTLPPPPTPRVTPTPSPTAMPTPSPTASPTAMPTAMPTASPTAMPTLDPSFMKDRVNVLILGWDESPERTEEGSEVYRSEGNNFRSDVIMLLSVNFKSGRVDLISVPRDTYATIYKDDGERYSETGRWKINAAFAKGGSAKGLGFEYAMTTVSKLLGGVPIKYYAGVDMTGMKAVVDAMGGVDYDVDVHIELNGRVLEKGQQHLTGQQVLDYCRARKGISTDVGRTDRQQRMLFTIFDQLKSRDQLKNFMNIYNGVKGYIRTNLDAEQIAAMVTFAMGIDMDDLHRKTLDGEYISKTPYNGASYYVLYNEKLVELCKTVFGVTIVPSPQHDVEYVLSDKAAATALKYVSAAKYLRDLARQSYEQAETEVPANIEIMIRKIEAFLPTIEEVSVRKEDEDLDLPMDRAAIEADTAILHALLEDLSSGVGLTRARVTKSELPSALYEELPKK